MKFFTRILAISTILALLLPTNIIANTFTDVSSTDYYATAASKLADMEILRGYEDGTFRADLTVTRAEMATIICRMVNLDSKAKKAKGQTIFDDVSPTHWASGYINVASEEKIINGDGNGKFRPSDNVRYEEAVKMIVCALELDAFVISYPNDWSRGYIEIAEDYSLLNNIKGKKGEFLTRGDIAVMVCNGIFGPEDTDISPSEKHNTNNNETSAKIDYYKGSVVPKYESVTLSPQVASALSFSHSNAVITRYFYNSSEAEKELYAEYLISTGWIENGSSNGGDTRGRYTALSFTHQDENNNDDAYVTIYYFEKTGEVDILTTLKD